MGQELAQPQPVSGRLAVQLWPAKLGAFYLPGSSHKVDSGDWLMSSWDQGSEELVWLGI